MYEHNTLMLVKTPARFDTTVMRQRRPQVRFVTSTRTPNNTLKVRLLLCNYCKLWFSYDTNAIYWASHFFFILIPRRLVLKLQKETHFFANGWAYHFGNPKNIRFGQAPHKHSKDEHVACIELYKLLRVNEFEHGWWASTFTRCLHTSNSVLCSYATQGE